MSSRDDVFFALTSSNHALELNTQYKNGWLHVSFYIYKNK